MNGAWYVPLTEDRPGGVRVFAFAHAGAGVAQLVPFAAAVAAHGPVVWGASLPGRQARLDEPARIDFRTLVGELVDALTPLLDRPYTLLGYCGGALLAYGVAVGLVGQGVVPPRRLLVVSAEAPDVAVRPRRVAEIPAELLWSALADGGGVPESMAGDARLRAVAEPAIRADFTALASYRHEVRPPMPLPITVLYGERDGELRRGALLGWRRQSALPLRMCGIPGGHWLLDDAYGPAAEAVAREVAP